MSTVKIINLKSQVNYSVWIVKSQVSCQQKKNKNHVKSQGQKKINKIQKKLKH